MEPEPVVLTQASLTTAIHFIAGLWWRRSRLHPAAGPRGFLGGGQLLGGSFLPGGNLGGKLLVVVSRALH